MNTMLQKPGVVIPSENDARLATESSRRLAKIKPETEEIRVSVNGEQLVLPRAVFSLLSTILTEMSSGNAVTIFPIHAELTTQEAAEFLNVSRPHLVKLLESKAIRFSKVGTHRRIKFSDLKEYKERREAEQEKALTELADQAQALKMGY
ncbi:MAG TPA: helix-turn-helix domain-containing protein [Dongiaceae bacterium]|jgi:excisionase family DNA binding protein|nr:helix-turn-helix domain-containing protein [Dongiaceae bacterium]